MDHASVAHTPAALPYVATMGSPINRKALKEADEHILATNDLIEALKTSIDAGGDNEDADAERYYNTLIYARKIMRQHRRNILHCLSVSEKSGGKE